jgi:putative membrane protein
MLATSLVILVITLHVWFLVLEMFLWTKPLGLKLMAIKANQAEETKILAMNQGLYNGMIAAYLIWALVRNDFATLSLILITIIIAGLYGAWTAKKPIIFFIQTVPATLALIALKLAA